MCGVPLALRGFITMLSFTGHTSSDRHKQLFLSVPKKDKERKIKSILKSAKDRLNKMFENDKVCSSAKQFLAAKSGSMRAQ